MINGPDPDRKGNSPPPVVAIGASAGGVEALQHFFAAVPDDLGLAYVVIVHLAPDRKSELPRILARQTKMPVEQVGDHDTAKLGPNRVYVIAPDRKLEVTGTSIGASRFEQPRGQRAAIDLFFRSLAARHGDGFAVVLSGSGSDGALGAKAIKESGGLVLVQDPREAGHEGMPRAAISTGVADVVLPVRELAERLAVLARSKARLARLVQTVERDEPIGEAEERSFRGIFELLRRRTGHDFSRYKRGTMLRRLARRMQLTHREALPDYLDFLKENVEEVQALFDDLLIKVTTFFRDPEAWQSLKDHVVAPLIDQAEADVPIRAWVPGCATGEEAYSLAILFQEEIERRQMEHTVIIFASDVDEGALATAREGAYPDAIGADLSEARLQRYFSLQDHHYRVAGKIRDRVVFASHSMLRDPPFSRIDLISCRNLLIYLDRELQEQVMTLFQYACGPDGYLFLGVSETADEPAFRAVDKKHRIFQVQKSTDTRIPLPALLATPRGILRQEREPRSPPRTVPPATSVDTGVDLASEFRVYHASSQTYRWTTVRAVPLKDSDGTVRGWVGMHIDVHERREAEEALRQADRRKDEFLAILGHELRNPLAAIRSSVAVHQATSGEAGISSRAWAIVDRQSGHMARLINDLLDIVRIDRGKLRLQRKTISLNQCVAEVVEAVQSRVDAAQLTLTIALPKEPLYVDADPERLVQILDNLLRNAVSYTDAGGKITISAREDGDKAVIRVSDTGIGMKAEQIEGLFEAYRQADAARPSGGLGLGLTLVKNLVKLPGGTVVARSDGPGAGSQFELTIPLAKDGPAEEAEPVELPRPRRVLVVDDETDVADMFAAMLESLGQQVVVVYSGEQALEAVRAQKPEIAFLDLSMPGMSGNELAQHMRKDLESDDLCLVALSGFGIESRMKADEFDRHLLKPASIEAVAGLLNSLTRSVDHWQVPD